MLFEHHVVLSTSLGSVTALLWRCSTCMLLSTKRSLRYQPVSVVPKAGWADPASSLLTVCPTGSTQPWGLSPQESAKGSPTASQPNSRVLKAV